MMGTAKASPEDEPNRGSPVHIEDPDGLDQEIAPGTILVGRYEVQHVLGQGGMGTVYLAEHVEVGRKVAVKVLSEEWSANSFVVRRFRAEARTASAIGHPNIVQVLDAGAFPDGRLFLVMEYLEGRDLGFELIEHKAIEPLRACSIMQQVALALGAAHAVGVVHRDLKPGNVMLVPHADGEAVKVLDFGIAANPSSTAVNGERLTRPGSVMGTPEYMAPEQATGERPNPSFDVYGMGAMLFEMLSGTLPITADHAFELLTLKRHRPAPSLRERMVGLPDSLVDLVDACLRIDPTQRPRDGNDVAQRLEDAISDLCSDTLAIGAAPAVQAQNPPPTQPTQPTQPRLVRPERRALPGWAGPAVIAVGVLALVGVLARGLWTRFSPAEDEAQAVASVSETEVPPRPLGMLSAELPPATTIAEVPAEISPPPAVEATPTILEAKTTTAAPRDAKGSEHASKRCKQLRAAAEESRRAQRWSKLRDLSRQRECWASQVDARKLQTKALMELGDFSGCLSAGKGLKDQEVDTWLKVCRMRGGKG